MVAGAGLGAVIGAGPAGVCQTRLYRGREATGQDAAIAIAKDAGKGALIGAAGTAVGSFAMALFPPAAPAVGGGMMAAGMIGTSVTAYDTVQAVKRSGALRRVKNRQARAGMSRRGRRCSIR